MGEALVAARKRPAVPEPLDELDIIAPTPGPWVDALPVPAVRRPPQDASVFRLLGYLVRLWWARWSNQTERAERRALGPAGHGDWAESSEWVDDRPSPPEPVAHWD